MRFFIPAFLLSLSLATVVPIANATEKIGVADALKLLNLPSPLRFSAGGRIEADHKAWKTANDSDGTLLLTSTTGESRAAIMKTADGAPESVTAYTLKTLRTAAAKAKDSAQPETSIGLFFAHGALAALVTCEDSGQKDDIGRICVTATRSLCQDLRAGKGIDPQNLKEMDGFEMRALASILTLRGSEHQLDNVLRSGNRLGLKTALQTTKGQLMTLAKQVAKELGERGGLGEVGGLAAPPAADSTSAAHDPTEARKITERAKADEAIAKSVLEKALPRLKDNCQNAKF